ncbi:MAG: DEAD/DEAH box helicase [Marinagarivorans sp.]
MFNGVLAKLYAGPRFKRADTLRDEREDSRSQKIEDFLLRYSGCFQKRRMSQRSIARFGNRIRLAGENKKNLSQGDLFLSYQQEIQSLIKQPHNPQIIANAFAIVGEACFRVFGYYPHDVQYMGASTLLSGALAEMQTGEGKTLVAGLAATIMASAGASVHVVSTNDYLAQRDAQEMQHLFSFFNLEAGSVIEGMEPQDRCEQYRKNICYVSGKELVFDYLKDRLSGHGFFPHRVAHLKGLFKSNSNEVPLIPSLHFVIVDEADSILIDEARTPLIISRDAEGIYEPELISWAVEQVKNMQENIHFSIAGDRTITVFDKAIEACTPIPDSVRPVWRTPRWQRVLLKQAITAVHVFNLDQQYILAEGKVQIVDESTGRVMPDRTWEQGLHQLIESKEGLEQSSSRETLAKMTFQRFFRRYFLLSGLTGTASESRQELWEVYGLAVRKIPPNRKNRRFRMPDICTQNTEQKWQCVYEDVIAAINRGQPVLVGTRSVEASEAVSAVLSHYNVDHIVLNARQDNDEAEIIRQAGQSARVTVATNMAGRGTDIKLSEEAREAGGLHVILTEFHESPRVDRQLFGRSGRQGDPGSTRAIVSKQDEVFKKNALWWSDAPSNGLVSFMPLIRLIAQWRAEQQALKARRQTLKQDKTLHQLIGFAGKTL